MASFFVREYDTTLIKDRYIDDLKNKIDQTIHDLHDNVFDFELLSVSISVNQPSPTTDPRFYALITYSHTVTKHSGSNDSSKKG